MKEGTKILLLEDNPIHREVLFDGLEDAGATVRKAESVVEARSALMSFVPDLLLFDIVLGDNRAEVLQFVDELRRRERLRDVPVLLVTAYLEEVSQEVLLRGIPETAVLAKPFTFDDLMKRIATVLKER